MVEAAPQLRLAREQVQGRDQPDLACRGRHGGHPKYKRCGGNHCRGTAVKAANIQFPA
jgi:hypothetical protein